MIDHLAVCGLVLLIGVTVVVGLFVLAGLVGYEER